METLVLYIPFALHDDISFSVMARDFFARPASRQCKNGIYYSESIFTMAANRQSERDFSSGAPAASPLV